MLEFATVMEFYAAKVDQDREANEYGRKAKCYERKMHEYLYDEITGLYSDYMSM